jgi:hypothetical protein
MSGNASRTPILIAVVGVAIGLLVLLNIFQQRNDPKYREQMEREAARKRAEEAAKNAPSPTPAEPGPANELVMFGEEKTLGKPGGSPKITVGWRWTPTVQGDPTKVYSAVQEIVSAAPNASVRVVNLDAKPGAVPEGLVVAGGGVNIPLLPDGSLPLEAVGPAIRSVAGSEAPAPSAASPSPAPAGAVPAATVPATPAP